MVVLGVTDGVIDGVSVMLGVADGDQPTLVLGVTDGVLVTVIVGVGVGLHDTFGNTASSPLPSVGGVFMATIVSYKTRVPTTLRYTQPTCEGPGVNEISVPSTP